MKNSIAVFIDSPPVVENSKVHWRAGCSGNLVTSFFFFFFLLLFSLFSCFSLSLPTSPSLPSPSLPSPPLPSVPFWVTMTYRFSWEGYVHEDPTTHPMPSATTSSRPRQHQVLFILLTGEGRRGEGRLRAREV